MYADLGPGRMLDLDPPSPNGVDLLYSHEYVANRMRGQLSRPPTLAERTSLYSYVTNNSVNYVDPSGLKKVCGFYVWLYTGLGWCVEENVYNAAMNAAGQSVIQSIKCWWNCEVDIHQSLAAQLGLGGAGGGHLIFTHLEVPKPPDLRWPGTGDITTLQRILAQRMRERGYERIAERLHRAATRVSNRPVATGVGSVARRVVIAECLFSIACSIKCGYEQLR